ncbi:hypothetical protein HY485_03790 [Candidatus Woesearchaeota archaeon]|nr:hypothetical protein [Candidatus Woesearchaeota archaeon]
MEPLKPEEIARMLKYGTRAEVNEYEQLLAQRFQQDPCEQLTPEQQAINDVDEQRLEELAHKFYPDRKTLKDIVETILGQTPLYCALIRLPSFGKMPSTENYSIGPKTNYTPNKESRTAIGVSPDAVEIILKDVKIDDKQTKLNGRSCYDFKATKVKRENGKVKLEGKLERAYDFGLGHQGRDYSGSTISGYVDKIEQEKDKPKIEFPKMPF